MHNVNSQSLKDNILFEPEILPAENSVNILFEFENLEIREKELLATQEKIQKLLSDISKRKQEIKEEIASKKVITLQQPIEIPQKLPEITYSILVVNTKQITQSADSEGQWAHYTVSLISKTSEKIAVNSFPVDVKKHGEIKQILITDGDKETAVDSDHPYIQKLIKYLSTDFKAFRKEINKNEVDHNGCYRNQYLDFDCQRFSYYLSWGKEGSFGRKFGERAQENYRTAASHEPIRSYSIKAETINFGKNGEYKGEDYKLHHYVCLEDDVFVSKYGKSDVFFTSYQQILDAYFPQKFTKGTFSPEFF